MLIARPAYIDDLDSLISLADKAGPGFTSLAVGPDVLEDRLRKSIVSYEMQSKTTPGVYLLMLEDTETKSVVGMSAVKAQIGITDPFFNFRVMSIGKKSSVTNRRYDMEVLMMVNEYNGATEVGSLYILPEMRGTGAGRLISQSRYMLMAADIPRFSDVVVSELRGNVDDAGISPFWEAIGRKFFQMDFTEADHFSAEQDSQFILDLMPRYPIYAALLPDDAREAMGQTHPAGIGARKLLEAEGFRYSGLIDIFDGGPSVSVPLSDIRTVKESRVLNARSGKIDQTKKLNALISNDRIGGFRSVFDEIMFDDNELVLKPETLENLHKYPGDPVRIWIKR